jgi:hypothetical protein
MAAPGLIAVALPACAIPVIVWDSLPGGLGRVLVVCVHCLLATYGQSIVYGAGAVNRNLVKIEGIFGQSEGDFPAQKQAPPGVLRHRAVRGERKELR